MKPDHSITHRGGSLIHRRTLRTKIITWSFVPTAIILLAVALVTFYAYQKVTEDLVMGRNQQVTRLAAGQLSADLAEHGEILTSLARTSEVHDGSIVEQRLALQRASNRLVVFDGGVVVLNDHGTVTASEPERPELYGQDWSNRGYFRQMLRTGARAFSNIIADGPQGADVVALAVPILGDQGEFKGTMVGMFRLGATAVSAFYGDIVKLRIAGDGITYLLDESGRVIYHSDSTRIGAKLPNQSASQQLLSDSGGEMRTTDADGRQIVASAALVPGTTWQLVSEESWDAVMASSQGYRQFLLLLLGLGVLVPAMVVTVGVRRITGPISELIGASKEVAAGKFGRTIAVRTGDELEELASQFNTMSAQLQESYADLERKVTDRTKELATLNAISLVVSQSLDLDEILCGAVEQTSQSIGADAGGIYLLDDDGKSLSIACQRGLSSDFMAGIDRLEVGEGFSGRVAETGEPLVVQDLVSDPRLPVSVAKDQAPRSLIAVPLSSRGRVLGVMFLASREHRDFSLPEVHLLTSIGHQVGVAVENGLLYKRAQQLAVLEERNRLARDLHDSVTQAVYGVTLYAEASTRLLAAGQVETAAEHLRDLRTTAQQALREMRALIFELRPPVLEKEGLVAALQTRLESVEGRAGVRAELKADGDFVLSRENEEGLYRIAQEALNNALKHARAQSISVGLSRGGGRITLEVVDDGVGFDTAEGREHGGLGFTGMEERATRLGGVLTVLSSPGGGTTVRVEVADG